jgi:hypothetical protein
VIALPRGGQGAILRISYRSTPKAQQWWNAYWLINLNMISQVLDKNGLDRYSAADCLLLNSPLNSPVAIARGFGKVSLAP